VFFFFFFDILVMLRAYLIMAFLCVASFCTPNASTDRIESVPVLSPELANPELTSLSELRKGTFTEHMNDQAKGFRSIVYYLFTSGDPAHRSPEWLRRWALRMGYPNIERRHCTNMISYFLAVVSLAKNPAHGPVDAILFMFTDLFLGDNPVILYLMACFIVIRVAVLPLLGCDSANDVTKFYATIGKSLGICVFAMFSVSSYTMAWPAHLGLMTRDPYDDECIWYVGYHAALGFFIYRNLFAGFSYLRTWLYKMVLDSLEKNGEGVSDVALTQPPSANNPNTFKDRAIKLGRFLFDHMDKPISSKKESVSPVKESVSPAKDTDSVANEILLYRTTIGSLNHHVFTMPMLIGYTLALVGLYWLTPANLEGSTVMIHFALMILFALTFWGAKEGIPRAIEECRRSHQDDASTPLVTTDPTTDASTIDASTIDASTPAPGNIN